MQNNALHCIQSRIPARRNQEQNNMTKSEFNLVEKAWAERLLSQPSFIMPNSRQSHDVAKEVLSKTMDRMLDQNRLDAHGQWAVRN